MSGGLDSVVCLASSFTLPISLFTLRFGSLSQLTNPAEAVAPSFGRGRGVRAGSDGGSVRLGDSRSYFDGAQHERRAGFGGEFGIFFHSSHLTLHSSLLERWAGFGGEFGIFFHSSHFTLHSSLLERRAGFGGVFGIFFHSSHFTLHSSLRGERAGSGGLCSAASAHTPPPYFTRVLIFPSRYSAISVPFFVPAVLEERM